MTTANKITIGRILLVPVFISQMLYYESNGNEWHRAWALLCFAVAVIADGVDGYIARHYNQRSELGALLDPLADKLLLVSALVLLTLDHRSNLPDLPIWLAATVVGRDVILGAGLAVLHYTGCKFTVRPRLIGKVATVLQMATILWAMLKWHEGALHPLALGAAVCTGISGLLYIRDGMNILGAHPSSLASTKHDSAANSSGADEHKH